jgi:hypothetical protein
LVRFPSARVPVELHVCVSLSRGSSEIWIKRLATDSNRYFVVGNLAESDEEVIRYAGLLRGTESAVQAVSVSKRTYLPLIVAGY